MSGEVLLLREDRSPVGDRRYPGAADFGRLLRLRGKEAKHGGSKNARQDRIEQAHDPLQGKGAWRGRNRVRALTRGQRRARSPLSQGRALPTRQGDLAPLPPYVVALIIACFMAKAAALSSLADARYRAACKGLLTAPTVLMPYSARAPPHAITAV